MKATESEPLPEVTAVTVGAVATTVGLPLTATEAVPEPAALTARTLTRYVVPRVNPTISMIPEVCAGETAVHVDPPSVLYS